MNRSISMIMVSKVLHRRQRYPTVGDWQFFGHDLNVTVSDTGHSGSEWLVAVHEIIEAILCKYNGVAEESVDKWDISHLDSPDPGSIPGCPYYREHMFATMIERALAAEMQVDWNEHEARLEAL
jgi:hypothetical protein